MWRLIVLAAVWVACAILFVVFVIAARSPQWRFPLHEFRINIKHCVLFRHFVGSQLQTNEQTETSAHPHLSTPIFVAISIFYALAHWPLFPWFLVSAACQLFKRCACGRHVMGMRIRAWQVWRTQATAIHTHARNARENYKISFMQSVWKGSNLSVRSLAQKTEDPQMLSFAAQKNSK